MPIAGLHTDPNAADVHPAWCSWIGHREHHIENAHTIRNGHSLQRSGSPRVVVELDPDSTYGWPVREYDPALMGTLVGFGFFLLRHRVDYGKAVRRGFVTAHAHAQHVYDVDESWANNLADIWTLILSGRPVHPVRFKVLMMNAPNGTPERLDWIRHMRPFQAMQDGGL